MASQKVKSALLALKQAYGSRRVPRVSVDHYSQSVHEAERGRRSWQPTIEGLIWLGRNGFAVHVAGRMLSGETEQALRRGYARLFAKLDIAIDAADPVRLVIFPELNPGRDVPEITEACWGILKLSPDSVMYATSRMVVKHKGEGRPAVAACTLLPCDKRSQLGTTLSQASGAVARNHPHCASFCVLGGAACNRS